MFIKLVNSTFYPQGHRYILYTALLSLFSFVFLKLSIPTDINRYPEFIYSVLFMAVLFSRKWLLQHDLGSRIFILSIVVPFLLLGGNWLVDSNLAVENFSATQLIKLSFFVIMGFWLAGDINKIHAFLYVAGFGAVLSLFQVDYVAEFIRIFKGGRVDFGLQNAQHTSMYFGVLLIGCLVFIPRAFKLSPSKWLSWVIWLGCFIFIVISIIVIVGAQTRAAWIGLVLVFLAFILLMLKKLNYKVAMGLLLIVLVSILSISLTENTIKKRVLSEASVISVYFEKGIDSVPYTSVGIRLHTWYVAMDKIKERPLIGYGAEVRESVIEQSDRLNAGTRNRFGHFHNSYLEFTLAYGLVGLGFLLFIFIWINIRIYQIAKKDNKYNSIWYFTLLGTLFMAVINCFESYLFFRSGVYTMSILLAPAYSLHLADIYKNKVNIEAS